MAEHQLTCRTCGTQFTYHRRKAYCSRPCRPGTKFKGIEPVATDCEQCGKKLPDRRHPKMRFCDEVCRRKDERSRLADSRQSIECEACGTAFKPRGSDRTRFCSRECGFEWIKVLRRARHNGGRVRHRSYRFKCATCETWSEGRVGSHRCSSCISDAANRPKVKGTERKCATCGDPFVAMSGGEFSSINWCSKACRNLAYRATPNYKAMQRQAKARRRARERGAPECERIDPIKVFERDRWRCGICGCKTHKAKRGTYHPKAPELDHIVALANGGAHTWQNVQCACRECNGKKGASDYGQLNMMFDMAAG